MSDVAIPCRNCGGSAWHLHHAIPKSICEAGRYEGRNLIDLCPDCHSGWHDRSLVIFRDVFEPHEMAWISLHASEGWLNHWYPARPEDFGVF